MFIQELTSLFEANANPEFAAQMKSYLQNKFELYGIKTGPRREYFKEVLANNKAEVAANVRELAKTLYASPYREMHHCGAELVERLLNKSYHKEDIKLIEYLITTNSWWDTVDFIAKQILGRYLKLYPEEIPKVISNYSNSKNMWLNRSTILFQLGYKKDTDTKLLFSLCLAHKNSDEFFIQKAIGWSLREYGKTNPEAVLDFVKTANLQPLSVKEAIRNII